MPTTTETKWTLPTPDGFTIYGVKNSLKEQAEKAIFIVHGLTGNYAEYHLKRAADYFSEKGYDVYRFNLYDGDKGGRKLVECTLETHAHDFKLVYNYFAKSYKKTFAIGHSYGGPTVMLATPQNLTAASLWDPSFDLAKAQKDFSDNYEDHGNYDVIHWGTSYLIGKPMRSHAKTLDKKICRKLAEDFGAPVQVILAGDGYYVKQGENYDSSGHPANQREVVEGTIHCFYEGKTCDELLEKTDTWFENWK